MTRGGTAKDRGSVDRRCIVTGEVQPKQGLIRFVAGPDGSVVPDIAGKLPGRGVWVTADRGALETAVAKRLFGRGLKTAVTVPEGLVAEVERQLVRRLVELIGLARKSGGAVAGYEKAKDWLDRGRGKVLIQASDGSERGKGKLNTPRDGRYVGCLTADELGLAFGRQTVVHAALASGGLGSRVVEEAQRLKGVRELDGGMARREGKRA